MKRILIILSIIIIVAGVAVLFYLFTRTVSPMGTTPLGQTGALPGAPTQQGSPTQSGTTTGSSTPSRFGIISNDPAIAYYVDARNNTTIIEPNGFIETITNGQGTVISSSGFQNIIGASFSYDGKKIIVLSGDQADPETSLFDLTTRSWTALPQGMQSPAWSPYSYQIGYLANAATGIESIDLLNAGVPNAKPSILMALNMQDAILRWPAKNTLVISDEPSAYTIGSAWLFNIAGKTLTPAVFEYPAMESIWSDATNTIGLVFSGSSGNQGGQLSLLSQSGGQENITFVTLPSKCVFSEISALRPSHHPRADPRRLPNHHQRSTFTARFPVTKRLYQSPASQTNTTKRSFSRADDFYEIDTANGGLNSVFSDPTQNLDATDLAVFNGTLFFINRYDQKLYGISL